MNKIIFHVGCAVNHPANISSMDLKLTETDIQYVGSVFAYGDPTIIHYIKCESHHNDKSLVFG